MLKFVNILLLVEGNPVQMRCQCFYSAVMANSKLDKFLNLKDSIRTENLPQLLTSFQLHLPEIVTILNQKLHLSLAVLFSGTICAVILEVHIRSSVSSASLTACDHKVIKNLRQHARHISHSEASIITHLKLIHVWRESSIVRSKSLLTPTSI